MFGSQTKSNSFSFGSSTTANQTQPGGLFGTAAAPAKPTFGFGTSTTQQPQQQSGGLFGSNTPSQPQQSTSLFGTAQPQQSTGGGLFGSTATQPAASGGLFGSATQAQPSTSIFGAPAQPQQQSSSLFGQPQQASGFGALGQSQQQQPPQRPLDQTLRFGQSQQGTLPQQNGGQPLWEEGRGMGVYRSIPAQMGIIKDKWDPASLTSPLRTYLYQHVSDEADALAYRPGPGEDENKWEEAVQNRPSATWVPLQIRGFYELGKKAQIQMEAIQRCNMMLQEINTSLDIQLDTHRHKVATRMAECKRRHQAASQRTLALAVKVQILRNRGYVMDNAEEELRSKIESLGREVFDPSIDAREQEIWARMLGIRERAKRLKAEMDKIAPATQTEEPLLDEDTVKAAKQTLEAYDTQLRHLQKELQLVQQEYTDWEALSVGRAQDRPRRR